MYPKRNNKNCTVLEELVVTIIRQRMYSLLLFSNEIDYFAAGFAYGITWVIKECRMLLLRSPHSTGDH